MADLTGQTLRGYTVLERIGAGGQGIVYKARQNDNGEEVSLKVLRPELINDADTVRRFQMEAVVIFMLKHQHIVPLVDYWHEDGRSVLVMRWMRGGNLRQQFMSGGWDAARTATLLDQLSGALTAAHALDVIHRDIKPDNVLFDEAGSAHVTDFGVAKLLKANLKTDPGVMLGTPAYYSPEQLLGKPITAQTDIYTLGVTLYETLTAQHPFPGAAKLALGQKIVTEPIPDLAHCRPDLPRALNAVLQRATAKNPAERYPTIAAFAAAFRAAVGE